VLLDGPKKAQQLRKLKTMIRHLGRAGHPGHGFIIFSIAGVAARVKGPFARGGAESVGMDGGRRHASAERHGVEYGLRSKAPAGVMPSATPEQLLAATKRFSRCGACPSRKRRGRDLGAHPDDPPRRRSAASRVSCISRSSINGC